MKSCKIHKLRVTLIIVVTIFLLISSILDTSRVLDLTLEERGTFTVSSHTTTRRQAILDYLQALYVPREGIFNLWLGDTPTDYRIGSYRHISNVNDPYTILKQLNGTEAFDWSNCTKFLESLVNVDPSSIYYNLVNNSYRSPPSTLDFYDIIQLFSELGLKNYIHKDEIANYIASCQTSDGGFRSFPFNEDPAGMMQTCFSLQALESIGRIPAIDTTAALNYVLSCYHNDGGFSNVPDAESMPDIVPLGLFSLRILGRSDLIRVQNTTDYLLQYFDDKGTTTGGTLVNTERLVWSLYTLGTMDQIDIDQMLIWVLQCETTYNGAFLPTPASAVSSERLEWMRAAVHILYLCDRINLLDEEISVTEYPEYHIPQWYIDYINEHFATTTDTGGGLFPSLPHIDIIAIFMAWAPAIGVGFLGSLPAVYIVWAHRKKKLERREQRGRRKHMSK